MFLFLFLQVLYVDSLETDAVDVPEDGTRICVWTNKLVRLVVELDTNSDGSFGKLPVSYFVVLIPMLLFYHLNYIFYLLCFSCCSS